MKKVYYIMMMILAGMWTSSCSEDSIGQPPVDTVAPPPVENVRVEPTPGGAIIKYDLPNVTDISYVKGEYWFQGSYKIARASAMDNSMEIEGLGSIAPVEITLYVVDHSENVSSPTKASFNPGQPPIESIFKSLEVIPDWGGIQIQWDNPTGAEIGFTVYVTDSTGGFDDGTIIFSNAKKGEQVFRNLPDLSERKFGVSLLDKWGNTTPIKEWTVIPKFEELINRTLVKQLKLPWDNTSDQGGQTFGKMFDGVKITNGNDSWHTLENQPVTAYGFTVPVMFTVDLGSEVILSRFVWWQGRWADYFLYGHHNPRTFEVWGTTKNPDLESTPMEYWKDEWREDWTKLADCRIIRPSDPGATGPGEVASGIDKAAADAGHEFYMPLTPVRYLRFAVTSTWIGNKDNTITIHEIEFWGDDGIDN
jgi:hypothetical protein